LTNTRSIDVSKLDPETRCFALVGQFMQAWALMESSLHNAIGAALSIEITSLKILCANIEFGAKIYILRTLIDVSPIFPKEEKGKLQTTLRELAEYAKLRNMVAHNPFQPDESKKGVEFLVVKARGKYEVPKEVWPDDRFRNEGATIGQYRSLLDGLEARFQVQPLSQLAHADALRPFLYPDTFQPQYADIPRPMRHTMSPALLDYLSRQPQALPDNDQANQEKGVQTPESPHEKD
jgi:hypothetical protein